MPQNLEDQFDQCIEDIAERAADNILRELQSPPPFGTPVDTGMARDSWRKLGSARANTLEVSNDVPYIRRLNMGHSQQSPAGFVEAAVIRGAART